MYFNDDEIRRIKDAATGHLLDVAQDFHELKRSGVNYNCDCPRCKAAKKLSISPAKQIFKCFGCNELKGGDSVSFLMSAEGMTFNDALEYLAKKFNVILDQRPAIKKQPAKKMKKSSKAAKGIDVDSYCARMLAESGLTFEDVTAKVYKTGDTQSIFEQRTFRPGTIDERGMLTTKGDDVIIEYYDLEGMPVVFTRKDNKRRDVGTPQEYYRIRWQFPDAHLDKEGKPYKYKSPRGSGTPIYIPERIRSLYKSKTKIPRLYIQEGEKKAEKAMVINKKITVSILSIYGISLQAVCCGSFLVNIEDALRLANRVNGHLLVGFKAMSRNDTVRLFDTDKLIRINSLCPLVPIQQLCIKLLTFQILYMHIPHQFP